VANVYKSLASKSKINTSFLTVGFKCDKPTIFDNNEPRNIFGTKDKYCVCRTDENCIMRTFMKPSENRKTTCETR
jgi:hypothetical protein